MEGESKAENGYFDKRGQPQGQPQTKPQTKQDLDESPLHQQENELNDEESSLLGPTGTFVSRHPLHYRFRTEAEERARREGQPPVSERVMPSMRGQKRQWSGSEEIYLKKRVRIGKIMKSM